MTIKRQYVLPNCSLILEGLSTDASEVLSILANAEFKIVGIEQSLSGGTEFFKALIVSVSAYCQRLISGLDHPEHMATQASSVVVEPDEGQYHRLIVKPELLNETSSDTADGNASQSIKLSTVQLFDMAEAIDQFEADGQTLPDVSVGIEPLPRKFVRAAEPIAQRAFPPLLGMGTLAVAALGLFFLPVPELVESDPLEQQNTSVLEEQTESEITTSPIEDAPESTSEVTADETDAAAVDGAETNEVSEAAIQTNGTITDSAQLVDLQQQVQTQISDRLSGDTTFEQPLSYQISVAENGDIVGYKPLDDGPSFTNVDSTPIPELTYIVDEASIGALAQFDVTFATDGTVEVVSDQIVTPEPEAITPEAVTPEDVEPTSLEEESLDNQSNDEAEQSSLPTEENGTEDSSPTASGELSNAVAIPIQDVDLIYDLNQELRRTIIDNLDLDQSGQELRYRVRLDRDGSVTGYEPSNSAAAESVDSLQLSSLVKVATDDQPQLDFLVVVNDEDVVEVNPWDGWP